MRHLAVIALTACLSFAAPAAADSSPAAYRANAESICKRFATAGAAAAPRSTERSKWLHDAPRLLTVVRAELRELRALRPPAALRQAHEDALAARAGQLALAEYALRLVRNGASVRSAATAIQSRQIALVARERAAWRRAGVAVCGEAS
jgi:hypothetical protein